MKRMGTMLCALALSVTGLAISAAAQDYPNKPIRLVVPFPPGGPTDVSARLAAEYLSPRLGQPVVVENKPGAGTAIGLDLVDKSPPDGYVLAWATSDGLSVLPALKSSLPYRVPEDFSFAATIVKFSGQVLTVNPKLPYKSLAELIAYAKANPGKLRFANPGVGSGVHMGTALIAKTAGIDIVHVPFQGQGPGITAAVGGHVDGILVGATLLKPHAESGALRALAVADPERQPQFPDVPTLKEAGLTDVILALYVGLVAPAGTPEPVLLRLRKEMAEMARDSKLAERFRAIAAEPAYLDGAAFRDQMLKDLARWKEVARSANIAVD